MEVENKLRQSGTIGSFVVRESTTRHGQWTLSLKISSETDCVRHFAIKKEGGHVYIPEMPDQRFTDLRSLILKWSHLCVRGAGELFGDGIRGGTESRSRSDSTRSGSISLSRSGSMVGPTQDHLKRGTLVTKQPAGIELQQMQMLSMAINQEEDIDLKAPPRPSKPSHMQEVCDSAPPALTDVANSSDSYVSTSAAKRMFDKKLDYSGMKPPPGISASALRVVRRELISKFGPRYETMKTHEVSQGYIMPLTKDLVGHPDPVDQHFLNYMNRPENTQRFSTAGGVTKPPVGESTVFVSHAWMYNFKLVMDVILAHLDDRGGDGYVWFDMFTNSQHDTSNRPYEWWQNTFKTSIGVIGQVLLIMMPWNNPIPMTRAWCLFEVLCAIEEETALSIGMPEDQQDALVTSLSTGDSLVLQHLSDIDAKKADASNQNDKKMIFEVIQRTCGFDGINDKVKEHLRNWIIDTAEYHANKVDLGVELLTSVAKLFQRLGKTELSQTLYERRLVQAKTKYNENHPMVGQAWANLGAIYTEMRQPTKAIDCGRKALKIFFEEDNADASPEGQKDIAMTYMNLGHAYKRTNHPRQAQECYERAEDLVRALCLVPHATKEVKKTFANTCSAVGVMLRYFGDPAAAIPKHKEALQMKGLLGLGGELSTAVIYHNVALAHRDLGQFQEATEALRSALHIRRIILGAQHNDTINTTRVLEDVESQICNDADSDGDV